MEGQNCAIRDQMRHALKGLHVLSIKWRCAERVERFVKGDPVWALFGVAVDSDGQGGREYSNEHFPAHVISLHGSKAIIFVEAGAKSRESEETFFIPRGRGFCKRPLSKMTKREGERDELCQKCGNIPVLSRQHERGCMHYRPREFLGGVVSLDKDGWRTQAEIDADAEVPF